MPEDILDARLLDDLTTIVSQAAAAILTARQRGLAARTKANSSPVTAADQAAEAVILEGLGRLLPGVPAVSEEAAGEAPPAQLPDTFILVDPLDGTRELVAGRDEFAVNLAIVSGGRPVVGILAAPAAGVFWRGRLGRGAERLRLVPGAPASLAQDRVEIRTRTCPERAPVAAVSRSHLDDRTRAFLDRLPHAERLATGSAIKFGLLAEGSADIYPRFGPVFEWDVAAGQALLAAAGGRVETPDGHDLPYGRIGQRFLVPGFIAWGDPGARRRLGL